MICADGQRIACGAAVLTTGTFLRGVIHIGDRQTPAGRMGEAPSVGLAQTLSRLRPAARPPEDRHAAHGWIGAPSTGTDCAPTPGTMSRSRSAR